jgi:quinol monooxygenase YgiN
MTIAPRFARHTRVTARPGRRDELARKFLDTFEFLGANPACELTVVSADLDDPDAVLLTEIWTSEADHTAATRSPEVAEWAADIGELVVEAAPVAQRLDVRGVLSGGHVSAGVRH